MWFPSHRTSGRSRARPARSGRHSSPCWIVAPLEDRTLLSFLAPVSYPVDSGPTAVAVGDFNRDGKLDLVTANENNYGPGYGSDVSVLLGNGDGTFQAARNFASGAGLDISPSVAVGDFNGDGNPDIVETSGLGISVLPGNGDGSFQPVQNFSLPDVTVSGSSTPLPQYPLSVAVGDLNGDGKLDLVVTGTTNDLVS